MLLLRFSAGMIRFVCVEIGVFASDQGGFVGMRAFFVKNVICYAILICERKDRVLLRLWKGDCYVGRKSVWENGRRIGNDEFFDRDRQNEVVADGEMLVLDGTPGGFLTDDQRV